MSRATRLVGIAAVAALVGLAASHAGIMRSLDLHKGHAKRRVLRVWDWWSPSTQEKYTAYFASVKQAFERSHSDVEVVYQFVPFGQYEQKMTTALVGESPPDVFQSSVYWAEGFYDRGALLPLNRFLDRDRAHRQRQAADGLPGDSGKIVAAQAFLPSAWRHNVKPDGIVFGIPQVLDSAALIWNLNLLRQAAATDNGIRSMFERRPDGSPDWQHLRWNAIPEWQEFRRIARRLTRYDAHGHIALDANGNALQAGFAIHAHGGGSSPFMPWCAANGSSFEDSAGIRAAFADPAGVEAMQFLLDLYWKDHVSPPFRLQMDDEEEFDQGHVACMVADTGMPYYIARDTDGKIPVDVTAFPPGPHGHRPTTLTWGNMLVISARTRQPDLAWDYLKCVTSLSGSLRLLEYTESNSPRKDFYSRPEWRRKCEANNALHNIYWICASGQKMRHTQIAAVDYVTRPIFQTLLLQYPAIESGKGPYPSVEAGIRMAADAADRVYRRYHTEIAYWQAMRSR